MPFHFSWPFRSRKSSSASSPPLSSSSSTLPKCSASTTNLLTKISLRSILSEQTKSPIRREDLLKWLRWKGGVIEVDGMACIDFLSALEDYKRRFRQLSPEETALCPRPPQLSSLVSVSGRDTPHTLRSNDDKSYSKLGIHYPPTSSNHTRMNSRTALLPHNRPSSIASIASLSSIGESIIVDTFPPTLPSLSTGLSMFSPNAQRGRSNSDASNRTDVTADTSYPYSLQSSNLLYDEHPLTVDPDRQPLRSSMNTILSRFFIKPSAPRPLHHLTSHSILRQSLSESALTTHPDILEPVAEHLREWFTAIILPEFLDMSVKNLNKQTARGRLTVGFGINVMVVGLTILLLLDPSPLRPQGPRLERAWRLLLVPLLIGGIGYALGGKAAVCFWLGLFGIREPLPFEEEELMPLNNGSAASLTIPGSHEDKAKTQDVTQLETWRVSSLPWTWPQPSTQVSTLLPSTQSKLFSITDMSFWKQEAKRSVTGKLRKPHPVDGSKQRKDTVKKWLIFGWRMTGTAWNTRKVQEKAVLDEQRRGVKKLIALLLLGLTISAIVLWFLPYIHVD